MLASLPKLMDGTQPNAMLRSPKVTAAPHLLLVSEAHAEASNVCMHTTPGILRVAMTPSADGYNNNWTQPRHDLLGRCAAPRRCVGLSAAREARTQVTRAPVAVVDCGTNTTRLLVTRSPGAGLVRCASITRLGRGVEANGSLDPEAVERTLTCLGRYRAVMDDHGVAAVRAVATSAVRDATNGGSFLDEAAAVIGAPVEVLSGSEEAHLAFRGAAAELQPALRPHLVVDIGGGSTEFSYGTAECQAVMSADIGSVRLTEKYLHHDPPLAEELSACLSVIRLHLDDVVREIPEAMSDCSLVGVAGTVTTVAAVEIGLTQYDRRQIHHFRLSKAAVEDVFRTLATESLQDRLHNPGLHSDRADVILAGICILVEVMRYFDFEECLVSESDLLDGLAFSLLET